MKTIRIEIRSDFTFVATWQETETTSYLINSHHNLSKLIASLTPEFLNRFALSVKYPEGTWWENNKDWARTYVISDEQFEFDHKYGYFEEEPIIKPYRKPKYKDARFKLGKIK